MLTARVRVGLISLVAGALLAAPPAEATTLPQRDVRLLAAGRGISMAGAEAGHIALLALAWDMTGSEFAGRHMQYEKFYAGASFIIRNHSYRETDWN